ncbi:MAG: CRISPR-associated endonuclease Cas2 [Ignavibacteriaceae bacterium]|nr:CRISPR-associated endonuclease Cas2 [Ignavibacteriaceae bacterium]
MFYIVCYDISTKKNLPKVLKTCRKYLTWVQKSVFEGELTESSMTSLKRELKGIIDKKKDLIFFYEIRTKAVVEKHVMGKEKNENSFIII